MHACMKTEMVENCLQNCSPWYLTTRLQVEIPDFSYWDSLTSSKNTIKPKGFFFSRPETKELNSPKTYVRKTFVFRPNKSLFLSYEAPNDSSQEKWYEAPTAQRNAWGVIRIGSKSNVWFKPRNKIYKFRVTPVLSF